MHPRFTSALTSLDETLRLALTPVLKDTGFNGCLSAETVSTLRDNCGLDDDALALALLPVAASYALTPLSQFNVGAIARGVSGRWYLGANMEFSGAPLQQTVHAEQSAITHAWLSGETQLSAVTVNYTPCGHCRQFMNELNSGVDLRICLPGKSARTLAEFLPDAFGPADLDIHSVLMDQRDLAYPLHGDALSQAAISAASQSYAPYSCAFSGVAVETADGAIYAGRYAENAAYNPTLPPLQAALILLNMRGGEITTIRRAVLAENPDAMISQYSATAATLSALGCDNLHRVSLPKP